MAVEKLTGKLNKSPKYICCKQVIFKDVPSNVQDNIFILVAHKCEFYFNNCCNSLIIIALYRIYIYI